MKKYLLFFLLITASSLCFAQDNYEDVIYLKNGSIIRGMIVEQLPGKTIKIETAVRDVAAYQLDEIDKIAKELKSGTIGFDPKSFTTFEPGHVSITEVAYRVMGGIHGSQFVKLNLVNAYRFKSGISLGFGTGFKYSWHGKYIDIPFFADFRGRFNAKKISPYWAFGMGYVFDASNKMKGQGVLVNPSAGVSLRVSDKTSMNVGLGYERQEVTERYIAPDFSTTQNYTYIHHSLTLNVGFTF